MARLRRFDLSRVHPWAYFLVFTISNGLLSYAPVSFPAKGWVFVLGLLVPLLILFANRTTPGKKLFPGREPLSLKPKAWVWIALGGLGLFLRLVKLTSFHLWPTGDEGLHGFLAIPLAQKWDWQFFYTVGEHPPLLIWVLSLFFKLFPSPFFDLWFLPALFSILAVPAAYLAARRFFPPTFSFLFGLLFTLSFWPLFFGRFCHQGLFLPFWELSSFLILGFFLNTENPRSKTWRGFGLGLWVGLGSLTFTSWAVVILLVTLTVFFAGFARPRKDLGTFAPYAAGLFLALLPFLAAAWIEGYGHHLIDSSAASSWFSRSHQILTYLSYVTCLFWGNLQPGASYAPSWGGVLNPVLASCFFLGVARLFRHRQDPLAQWLGGGFIICLLPGFLAADYVEFNRVVQVMPFLLVVAALGIQTLAENLPSGKKIAIFALLLASFALDINHLFKPVLEGPLARFVFKKESTDENFRAYRLFNDVYQGQGPGLVFTDFLLLSHGHSLNVTTYHFNAALNPNLYPERASWAGLVVNFHYQPFLLKRFPGSYWYPLSAAPGEDGGLVAGIIPITPGNRALFDRWVRVHRYFHDLNLQAENILNNKKSYQSALDHLPEGYPLVEGDPFLESCFGEWLAQYHYGPTCDQNIAVLRRALLKGYPAANLYYKLGNFLYTNRQMAEARSAYLMAVKSKPNYTNAEEDLKLVEGLLKENRPGVPGPGGEKGKP